ncbi:potassium-transporting ATPase subunit C [Phyllobacterium phragmitis]|uniref:Potassium-transporting ATPase KdpC subunit n=1 Tax=Phyllobacterium phragmitis TaxID=2670329 RepID=A0A2S9IQP3_9HYPH|nr:potassium-transporting ATPase subunit C [Phyllobacterium phragmitis]PRD42841.1 potassium-transporting ATPase subunit C [Phyllobacterium phragmitis]
METLLASLRISVATMLICVGGYSTAVWAFGQTVTPGTAEGSLITLPNGTIVGSRQIAQGFTPPKYFWPRPSAVDYNADAAGGSNKSPTSADLTKRAEETIARYGATPQNPLPAELATASGSGLDPNISEHAALYQAPRVAAARGLPIAQVEALIHKQSFKPGGFLTSAKLVNVLELNLALDQRGS